GQRHRGDRDGAARERGEVQGPLLRGPRPGGRQLGDARRQGGALPGEDPVGGDAGPVRRGRFHREDRAGGGGGGDDDRPRLDAVLARGPARPGEEEGMSAPPESFGQLRIGPLSVWPPVVLAPMAGVTNYPFRSLCREFGAGLYVSEMITARGYLNGNRLTRLLASSRPD